MSKWLNSHQRWGSFVLRLALGLSLTIHGYEKLFPHGALHAFEHFVSTLGLPRPLGIISAYTEFIGGILLLLGLFTRDWRRRWSPSICLWRSSRWAFIVASARMNTYSRWRRLPLCCC